MRGTLAAAKTADDGHYKDSVLAELATRTNIAQFASFGPGASAPLRALCVNSPPRVEPRDVREAVALVLSRSSERSVNVRAFDPMQPKAHDFIYGLTEVADAVSNVLRLAASGLYTIVNETVDIADGGVSGVLYGGVVEFAPGDTPRCVEKPGTAAFDRTTGLAVLETVYRFGLDLQQPDEVRTEFSIHPLRRGMRNGHTLIWEEESTESVQLSAQLTWPNRFSHFLGDKTFGLLVADAIGLNVPSTFIVARGVAPFSFGRPTLTGETWIRTAPVEPVPGHFTTRRGWIDPFDLIRLEDPSGTGLASVLAQDGVEAVYAGAAAVSDRGLSTMVEGVRGTGERFMLGEAAPEPLPERVTSAVRAQANRAANRLGPVRIEWVFDGTEAWVVQLHAGGTVSRGRVVFPGGPHREHRFPVDRGVDALRELAQELAGTGEGIVLVGNVGVTSHLGDVLRKARIPSRIESATSPPDVPALFP